MKWYVPNELLQEKKWIIWIFLMTIKGILTMSIGNYKMCDTLLNMICVLLNETFGLE